MKKMFVLLLSMILLTMITGCENEEVGNKEAVEVSEKSKDIESENIAITLNNITRTKEDKWNELEEGMELILVNITIKNNSEEEYEFNPNYVRINVDGFTEFQTDKSPVDEDSMRSKLILPDEEYTRIVPFEIEEGQEYRNVVYDDFDIVIELE